MRMTKFSDVCGTVDEMKRLLHEEPQTLTSQPALAGELLEDITAMLERMDLRLRVYQQCRDSIRRISRAMEEVGDSRRAETLPIAETVRGTLTGGRELSAAEVTGVCAQLEMIREVAADLETKLYRYRDLFVELQRTYQAAKGTRDWSGRVAQAGEDVAADSGVAAMDMWWWQHLPPTPHREKLLESLRKGRAWVLPKGESDSPRVEFEDGGGGMPLSAVRWSDEVQNFYPDGSPPHPRGKAYR